MSMSEPGGDDMSYAVEPGDKLPPRQRTMPRYTHDCDRCRFLGTVDKYDIYVCPDTHDDITMIARYSSEGSNYASNGFMKRTVQEITAETSGLTEDQALVLALFRRLPSLILNIWSKP